MRYGVLPADVKTAVIPEVVSAPWCNAKLDHGAWESAAVLDGFTVRMNGRTPDVATEARVFADGRNIQVAFLCDEPDMAGALEAGKDHVIVFVDAGLTRREFQVFNLTISSERSGSLDGGDWLGAVRAADDGWVGQIAIPFESLQRRPVPGEVWGVQLGRVRFGARSYPEVSSWSPADLELRNPRDYALISLAGEMSGEEAGRRLAAVQARLQAGEDRADARRIDLLGPGEPPSAGELDLSAGSVFELDGRKGTVVEADNPEIIRSRYPFFYEDHDHPGLTELRERYELDRVIDGAGNDFEEAIRLQLWVIDRINFGSPAHHDYRALSILGDSERGKAFFCTHFSYVFMQCCMAVGINCRKISTIGHASDEFWSDHYRKWCTLECTRGHFFETGGVPLSALEVHNEYARDRGVSMDFSAGTDRAIRKVNLDLTPDGRMIADAQERYLWFAALMRNNILSVPFELGELRWLWWRDDANRDETEMEVHIGSGPTRFRQEPEEGWEPIRIATENEADLYYTLNAARMHLYPAGDSRAVEVRLETQTPHFARFEARMDGGAWLRLPAAFTWQLHDGKNALEARPVNAFGREGTAAKVKLEVG